MANVLIVDDDPTIVALFQYVFIEAGYTVETAVNGQDALEKLAGFIPDIIFTDIDMPVMNGKDFIVNLKKLSHSKAELQNIPFFVMTGENFMDTNLGGVFKNNSNFQEFIPKMTNPDEVLSLAKNAMGK